MARRYLTTAEIAERMRTSPSTIRYWRMTGYLPVGASFGRRVLYDEEAFDAWVREREAADATGREPQPAA